MRIDVGCDVVASARFRRAVFSISGSDLVLTIGLPLAAGLTLREFGGVLAHELGHFARGSGLRRTYLIRSVVGWFIRVVYQRDRWEDWIDETAQDTRIGWIFRVARHFVMFGRGILWALLQVGFAVCGVMLRRMEFDADRYQAQFAGSDVFATTHRKIRVLFGGWQIAQRQLAAGLDQRKLVDNLPGLIAFYARRAPPEAMPTMDELIAASKTSWLDSQPCDKDRISAVERLDAPGILHLERSAADLFNDLNAQAAAVTWDLYCAEFGPNLPRNALLPVQEYAAAHST
jgi:Zn-dependent protease with chaperone function